MKAQFQVGYASFHSGKYDEAAEAFKKAEALDATNAEIQYYLGSIAIGQNNVPECAARLEVRPDPDPAPEGKHIERIDIVVIDVTSAGNAQPILDSDVTVGSLHQSAGILDGLGVLNVPI